MWMRLWIYRAKLELWSPSPCCTFLWVPVDWVPMGWRASGMVLWGNFWFNFIQKGSGSHISVMWSCTWTVGQLLKHTGDLRSLYPCIKFLRVLTFYIVCFRWHFWKKEMWLLFLCEKEPVTSSAGKTECNHQDIGGACWGNCFNNSFLLLTWMLVSSSDVASTAHLLCHLGFSVKCSPARGQNGWF